MKKNKVIYVLVLLLLLLTSSTKVYADYASDVDGILNGMSEVNSVSTNGSKVENVINSVIKLIQIAGSGVAVITVTFLGIKYMIASSNEKADIKKQAVPIIIGCVLLFAAVNIAGIIASFGDSLN